MRLRLIGVGGGAPDSDVSYYRIMIGTGPRKSRDATDAEFKVMLGLQARIAAMATMLFGEDFIEVRPDQFEMTVLELLLQRGVPKRKWHQLEEFRGWLALFADEPSLVRLEGPTMHHQV